MTKLTELINQTKDLFSQERAGHSQYFFKTGLGQYGEGDIFWGLSVPNSRSIAKEYLDLDLSDVSLLLKNKVHELRLIALLILVAKYERASDDKQRKIIYNFYLKNRAGINNWDLVDLSVYKIMGDYLVRFPEERKILFLFIKSNNLWERRLAMVSTMSYIRNGETKIVMDLALRLLNDSEDLMHKAAGWMLRELGKRNLVALLNFLDTHGKQMPRTMLRYAIERLDEKQRKFYLLSTK